VPFDVLISLIIYFPSLVLKLSVGRDCWMTKGYNTARWPCKSEFHNFKPMMEDWQELTDKDLTGMILERGISFTGMQRNRS